MRSRWPLYLGCWFAMVVGVPESANPADLRPTDTSALSSVELDLFYDFKASYYRLAEFYGNVHLEANHSTSSRNEKAEQGESRASSTRQVLAYRSRNNEWFRMDVTALQDDEENPGRTVFRLVRSEGYLVAAREPDAIHSRLLEMNSNYDRGKGRLVGYRFHVAPFALYGFPLEYVLLYTGGTGKVAMIEKIATQELSGAKLATIYARRFSPITNEAWPMRFTFLRDQAWALKEYHCGDGVSLDGYQRKAVLSYSGDYQGIPLLERAEYWSRGSATEETPDPPWRHEVYEITNFVVGAVSAHEFTPEAIGLTIGRQTRRWGRRLVLAVGGGVLLAAYIVFRRRSAAKEGRGS